MDKYETTNHVAQVCWILHLNPNLVQVSIFGIPTNNIDVLHVLAKVIARLNRLEKLLLGLMGSDVLWPMLSYSYFLACPRSIRALAVLFDESTGDDDDEDNEDDDNDGDDGDPESEHLNSAVDAAVQKIVSWDVNHEGPRELDNQTFLTLEHLVYLTTEEVCELFEDCPNLNHLTLPYLGSVDIVTIGRTIDRVCPKLRGMISKGYADDRRWTLVLEIMESMEAPSLECVGGGPLKCQADCRRRSGGMRPRWRGYSLISTSGWRLHLFECPNPEKFILGGGAGWKTDAPALTVSEVVERKGASSRIKELNFRISLGDLASASATSAAASATFAAMSEENSSEPYYLRPMPIVLTDREQRQMALLEKFYRQLGGQTELEVLELWRIEPSTLDDDYDPLRDLTLPALLSLGDPVAGRPGFLGLWGEVVAWIF